MFITNGQVKYLFKFLNSMLNVSQETQFNYFITKNIKRLSKKVKKIANKEKEIGKPSEERSNFELERVSLLKTFSKKDKKGNPIIKDNQYVLTDQNLKKYKEQATELLKKYPNVQNELTEQANKLLDYSYKKTYIRLVKVNKEHLPQNLPAKTLLPIINLIKD